MVFPHISLPFCLFALIANAAALEWQHASREQFNSVVSKEDYVLVAFVAPWTESSKSLEGEWIAAAALTKKSLISIDCTLETKLCEENDIISYPTIRLFNGINKTRRYRGPRKASSIVPFMNRASLPSVSVLKKSTINSFRSIDDPVFIAYLDAEDTYLKDSFEDLALRNYDNYAFGMTFDAKMAIADSAPVPSVVCYKANAQSEILSSNLDGVAMEKFLISATTPVIGEMTRRNQPEYLQSGKSILYIFAETEKERTEYRSSIASVAKKYQDYISFVTIDAVEYGHMAPNLELTPDVFPAAVLHVVASDQVFPYNQWSEITASSIDSFVLDIVQGKTKPSQRHDEL